jgi:hypothetical protein
MLVAGLDLARRRDHSGLVLLEVEADRLTVSAALRLPQAPLRQQFTLIEPRLAGLDLLVSIRAAWVTPRPNCCRKHRRMSASA